VRTVKTNGINLAYEIQGQGHPLLLIAPLGYSSWFWNKLLPYFAGHFKTITFDNRGAGGSDKPDGPYTIALMAADTAGLLDELGLSGAFVFGYSLGGYIAQELAITRPDLVSRLVLAGTNHGGRNVIPTTPEALELMTKREGDPIELIKRGIEVATAPGFSQRRPEVVKELVEYRLTNPVPPAQYQAQVSAGLGMLNYSDEQVRQRSASIRVPVLILFGQHDHVIPAGNAQLMAEKLPHAEIRILPDTGHMCAIEDPEATANAVIEFLTTDGTDEHR
jgi:pimeloyl-ACP methyl ester carboxylesterase